MARGLSEERRAAQRWDWLAPFSKLTSVRLQVGRVAGRKAEGPGTRRVAGCCIAPPHCSTAPSCLHCLRELQGLGMREVPAELRDKSHLTRLDLMCNQIEASRGQTRGHRPGQSGAMPPPRMAFVVLHRVGHAGAAVHSSLLPTHARAPAARCRRCRPAPTSPTCAARTWATTACRPSPPPCWQPHRRVPGGPRAPAVARCFFHVDCSCFHNLPHLPHLPFHFPLLLKFG